MMTNRQIENRVRKVKELEAMIAELEAKAEAVKDELKAELEASGLEEVKTAAGIVRYKEITSARLNSKLLKLELPEIYSRYCASSVCKRFSVA